MFRCEMGDRNISKYLSTALTDVKNMKLLVVDGTANLTLKLRTGRGACGTKPS
jgi:hypothetical protein